jgi:hypothetical protein
MGRGLLERADPGCAARGGCNDRKLLDAHPAWRIAPRVRATHQFLGALLERASPEVGRAVQ